MAKLIARNTHLEKTKLYGWKHGIPYYPVLPVSCLFVVVVRDPFDWCMSFHSAPFEGHDSLVNLPFSKFIRAEWHGIYLPREAAWHHTGYSTKVPEARLQELQLDRHPITGRRYRNILEMRSVKLASHLGLLERDLSVAVVRYEDVWPDPEGFVAKISEAFGLERAEKLFIPRRNVSPRFTRKTSDDRVREISQEDRKFIAEQLDWSLENRVGYSL